MRRLRLELGALVAAAAAEPFDLAAGLPWRARLWRTGPAEHVLVLVMHHIAGDAWSMGVLARDVSAAYAARRAGQAPGWVPLPVQYADYAFWQRELLGDPDDPGSVLAAAGGVVAGCAGRGARRSWPCPPTGRVRRWPATGVTRCRWRSRPGCTPSWPRWPGRTGSPCSWCCRRRWRSCCARLGAGEDIPIGSPVAGRADEALDDLVGFFVNTLVLRTDVSGDPPFAELLGRVRETSLGALAHQDVPFEKLVEVLAPERSLARHPLFQVMVAVQNNAPAVLDLPGVRAQVLPAGRRCGAVRPARGPGRGARRAGLPAGLAGSLMAAADLFDAATAELLAGRLVRVLAAVAADPEVRVARGGDPGLRLSGRRCWRGGMTPAAEIAPVTVAELVAAQAARVPDAVAVCCEDECLTYARAGGGGRPGGWQALAGAGAGPEPVVAVVMDRGIALVAVLLGVWRAGAAYLPVDPGYPAERVGFMLADAGAAVVVADAAGGGGAAGAAGRCRCWRRRCGAGRCLAVAGRGGC